MFHVVFCILLLFIYMLAVVDQLPRLRKRELICLLLFTCNYVVSVQRGFKSGICLLIAPVSVHYFSFTFPLPLGAWDRLRYFIVALPEHSI